MAPFERDRIIWRVFDVVGDHYARRSDRPPIVSHATDTAYSRAIRTIAGYP